MKKRELKERKNKIPALKDVLRIIKESDVKEVVKKNLKEDKINKKEEEFIG